MVFGGTRELLKIVFVQNKQLTIPGVSKVHSGSQLLQKSAWQGYVRIDNDNRFELFIISQIIFKLLPSLRDQNFDVWTTA